MKIIFLDIDGVLNYAKSEARVGGCLGVDSAKVSLLKEIVDATKAKIVLSSTWRREITPGLPLEAQENPFAQELMSKLEQQGLRIYDLTPVDSPDSKRTRQIESLLGEYRHNGQQIDGWVVLDDDSFKGYDAPGFYEHVVLTTFKDGLTEENVQEAIKILNAK